MERNLSILQPQKKWWFLETATHIKKFTNKPGDLWMAKPIIGLITW